MFFKSVFDERKLGEKSKIYRPRENLHYFIDETFLDSLRAGKYFYLLNTRVILNIFIY